MSEPMSDSLLAGHRELVEDSQQYWELGSGEVGNLVQAANDLLAEVDRLRAEVARLRPVVVAVAGEHHCTCACSGDDCVVIQARAALAEGEAE